MSSELTPAMRQYWEIKKEYSDFIVLFRMGDFYETFFDDAKLISHELQIVLTSRGKEDKKIPLAGIPYHAIEPYLKKLIDKGHKIVIVEQLEDPKR
ncbi:MAG: DNA mismatch repair protein MutS, partial [Candidatus Micrarchaeia archaeon]